MGRGGRGVVRGRVPIVRGGNMGIRAPIIRGNIRPTMRGGNVNRVMRGNPVNRGPIRVQQPMRGGIVRGAQRGRATAPARGMVRGVPRPPMNIRPEKGNGIRMKKKEEDNSLLMTSETC